MTRVPRSQGEVVQCVCVHLSGALSLVSFIVVESPQWPQPRPEGRDERADLFPLPSSPASPAGLPNQELAGPIPKTGGHQPDDWQATVQF